MLTFEELCRHADPEMPVGALVRAWDRLGPVASPGNLMMEAGSWREQHRKRRVATPSAERHGQMLTQALEPTVRYVRRKVFGKEAVPLEAGPELLERLQPDTKLIAEATGFEFDDVMRWVLVGRPPRPPMTVSIRMVTKPLPDGRWMDATRMRIESSVPMTGEKDIRKAVSLARDLWGTARIKSWAEEDVRLLRAVQRAGGPPQGEGMMARWQEIAEEADLPSLHAAKRRWGRVVEKAERFGIPLDPKEGIDWWSRTMGFAKQYATAADPDHIQYKVKKSKKGDEQ